VHVELAVGPGEVEPVHVAPISGRTYRVLFSPGLVYGVAAGDEVEVQADGSFSVVRRGFNLAVRVLSRHGVAACAPALIRRVQDLGGRLDGRVAHGLVFTIPIAAGFGATERVFREAAQAHDGLVWEYANVYDADGRALGWWHDIV
jgi:hypothetical protein